MNALVQQPSMPLFWYDLSWTAILQYSLWFGRSSKISGSNGALYQRLAWYQFEFFFLCAILKRQAFYGWPRFTLPEIPETENVYQWIGFKPTTNIAPREAWKAPHHDCFCTCRACVVCCPLSSVPPHFRDHSCTDSHPLAFMSCGVLIMSVVWSPTNVNDCNLLGFFHRWMHLKMWGNGSIWSVTPLGALRTIIYRCIP